MTSIKPDILRDQILFQTKTYGATLAGIARVEDLKKSSSYEIYKSRPYYSYFEALPDWPKNENFFLIFALDHKKDELELDWWDPKPGGTPGNRILMQIQKKMKRWLKDELGIKAVSLPYKIEKGGIFLKDAAVLAGIGIIGKNNLLITPEFGPRIRLLAMFLQGVIEPTSQLQFDPCSACNRPCFLACPQNAFRNGSYERDYCQIQMKKDEDNVQPLANDPQIDHVRYCRACELACPVPR